MKRMIHLAVVTFIGLTSFAEPTVTDVVAKQRYPWNGLVDITCKVSGLNELFALRSEKRFEKVKNFGKFISEQVMSNAVSFVVGSFFK